LEYFSLLAHDLTFIAAETYKHLTNEVTEIKRMLTGLIQKLKAND
jgi:four helix bundle protein